VSKVSEYKVHSVVYLNYGMYVSHVPKNINQICFWPNSLQCNLQNVGLTNCKLPTSPHTHNHFMALLDFVWDYPGEPAPER